MSQTTLETSATSPYVRLYTLSYGATPTVQRYCRGTSDLAIGSDTFTALPNAYDDMGQQHGGTEDEKVKLVLPITAHPMTDMTSGRAHAKVTVTIEECDPTDASNTRITLYEGRISGVRRNPSGQTRLVQCTLAGPKSQLDVPLGIVATTTSAWRLGDQQNKVDVDSLKATATVTALNVGGHARRIVLSGDLSGLQLDFGYVEYDGLRIMIREDLGSDGVDLARTPPLDWLNQTVTVVPGFDKTIEMCRNVYNNEENFGGIGFAMPNRNPLFESPN